MGQGERRRPMHVRIVHEDPREADRREALELACGIKRCDVHCEPIDPANALRLAELVERLLGDRA